MSVKTEIEAALEAHAHWRARFKDFLNGRAAFDIDGIDNDADCAFGDWLLHEGRHLLAADIHEQIRTVHAEFHHIATSIVQHIRQKDFATAHAMIAPDGALNQVSNTLSELLLKAALHESDSGVAGPVDATSPATPEN